MPPHRRGDWPLALPRPVLRRLASAPAPAQRRRRSASPATHVDGDHRGLQVRPLLLGLRVHRVEAGRAVGVQDAAHGARDSQIVAALEHPAWRQAGDGGQMPARRSAPQADAVGIEPVGGGVGLQPPDGRPDVFHVGGEGDRGVSRYSIDAIANPSRAK